MKAVYEIYKDNPSVKNVTYGYKPSIPIVSAFIDSEEKNAIICTGFLEKNSVIFVDENQTKSSVNKKIKIGTKTFKKTTFDLLENNFLDNESLIKTINNTFCSKHEIRQLPIDNYSIFFVIRDNCVIILRVLYSASDIYTRLEE